MKARILFVDDERAALDGLRRILRRHSEEWEVDFASSAAEAVEKTASAEFDVVVSDVMMPGNDGFWLLTTLREQEHTKDICVLMLTGSAERDLKRRALDMGATDLLSKPVMPEDLIARLRSVLRLKAYQDQLRTFNEVLEQKVCERTTELEESRVEVIWRLAKAGEFRDEGTGNHVVRVSYYCRALATELDISSDLTETLFLTSPLHDIGKIGTPDGILLKQGPLTSAEREIMQRHCIMGHDILMGDPGLSSPFSEHRIVRLEPSRPRSRNKLLETAAAIALSHHERWDGDGYPDGLKGEDIPIEGRIVAIADVYDALCSQRIYKPAYPESEALSIIQQEAGKHFDPDVFAAFDRVTSEFHWIKTQLSDQVWEADDRKAA